MQNSKKSTDDSFAASENSDPRSFCGRSQGRDEQSKAKNWRHEGRSASGLA